VGHYVATVPRTLAATGSGYDVSSQTDFSDDDVAPMATTDTGAHAELFARSSRHKRTKPPPKNKSLESESDDDDDDDDSDGEEVYEENEDGSDDPDFCPAPFTRAPLAAGARRATRSAATG
jgi:hypothetical protein